MKEHTTHQVKVSSTSLGTMIVRFELDPKLVDEINKLYEEHKENLEPWNDNLAGKIADEKRVEHILTNEHKGVFLGCFKKYLEMILKPNWVCIPENAWINDMYAGEYNPLHFHSSPMTDLGLSSVFVLKRPSTYGKEFAREGDPTNGWLQFTGGDQSPLSSSQFSIEASTFLREGFELSLDTIVPSIVLTGSYSPTESKTQFYIYDYAKNLVHSNLDYNSLGSYLPPTPGTTTNANILNYNQFELNPTEDIYNQGFANGKYYAVYNFIDYELDSQLKEVDSVPTGGDLSNIKITTFSKYIFIIH